MPFLELKSITKEFPGVRALDRVCFDLERGEIHALCGENGAGKSTLIKVLSGFYPYGTYGGEAALYSGVRIERHIAGVFTLMGLLCGAAGIVLTARIGSATSDAGRLMELDAIAPPR